MYVQETFVWGSELGRGHRHGQRNDNGNGRGRHWFGGEGLGWDLTTSVSQQNSQSIKTIKVGSKQ